MQLTCPPALRRVTGYAGADHGWPVTLEDSAGRTAAASVCVADAGASAPNANTPRTSGSEGAPGRHQNPEVEVYEPGEETRGGAEDGGGDEDPGCSPRPGADPVGCKSSEGEGGASDDQHDEDDKHGAREDVRKR